ncbi:MAG TPA: hypothetical protein VFE37_18495 [Chloroflexota bacterium]|nr:hypothetical protein [Chloroflexota bacterium]
MSDTPSAPPGNGLAATAGERDRAKGPPVGVGILTKGKPTLSMVLVSLLMQEDCQLRVHIVDTSPSPVVRRDDVVFALRLAFDRQIVCEYEYSREKERAFSAGRQRLVEALPGPFLVFMDDDVVLPANTLARLCERSRGLRDWGYVTPVCKNYGVSGAPFGERAHYTPGGLIYQDEMVRRILLEYYGTTVDVLDGKRARGKVWESVFLSELFGMLGRSATVLDDVVTYHLDYHQRAEWHPNENELIANTRGRLRELVERAGAGPLTAGG